MSVSSSAPPSDGGRQRLTFVHWLILLVAAIGFAFDTYALLIMPLIARPALAQLLKVDPNTVTGNNEILKWNAYIMWGSAISGGIFGLLGGYLTDLFGRRRVLVWSILVYAFSAFAAAYSTSAEMLLVLRCTTFIGVCVEFVAAVAWLAELFPNPEQREAVIGYTQAFASIGGLLVAGVYHLSVEWAKKQSLPPILGEYAEWRYTLLSGVIPAIPLIIIRPFLPESPAWRIKKEQGTLRRPSIAELFRPAFARTTVVTAVMFACSFGAAFGAIQFAPQIVPGLVLSPAEQREASQLQKEYEQAKGTEQAKAFQARLKELRTQVQETVPVVQYFQEVGGLVGRFVLAWLAIRILSRRRLIRIFLVPGLVLVPLVFLIPGAGNLGSNSLNFFKAGMFLAGLFTVAQFSFWGNYLPRVYPTYLRGTGEGFAANVGGRMLGTAANPLTYLMVLLLTGLTAGVTPPTRLSYAAGVVAFLVYAVGLILSFWLPEPKEEALLD